MSAPFPARLHVLLASEAPVGVVLRRSPANAVCSVLWDRKKDTFEIGQWLRARIYERRADLSPDGRHLIYFAMNGRWTSEARGSWTAISRALVWAEDGCLHRAPVLATEIGEACVLFDFNGMKFERRIAPY